MLKVLQLVADGSAGGGTTAVLGLASDLKRSGHNPIICSASNSFILETARREGIEAAEIDLFGLKCIPTVATKLFRLLKRFNPDVIHVHGNRAAYTMLISCFLLFCSLPIVYTVHGFHFRRAGFFRRLTSLIMEWMLVRICLRVVYVSQSDMDYAARSGIADKDKCLLIRNGVNFLDFDAVVPVASKQYDVVFVGRLHRQKNPVFAAQVLRELAGLGYQCALAGTGDLKGDVAKELARSSSAHKVAVFGELDRKSALAMINQARVLLFPSLWEGLPITLIEAGALGVPVVASEIDGTKEIILSGFNGVLIQKFDCGEYVRAISSMLESPIFYSEASTNARVHAYEKFDRKINSSAYIDLYQSLNGHT